MILLLKMQCNHKSYILDHAVGKGEIKSFLRRSQKGSVADAKVLTLEEQLSR